MTAETIARTINDLQEQGVFRTEYEGTTLRHPLGLAHPDDVRDKQGRREVPPDLH
jgi:hypothetical protein